MDDKMVWKFTHDGSFFVKTATWTNNNSLRPHQNAKFSNSIWKLNLVQKNLCEN